MAQKQIKIQIAHRGVPGRKPQAATTKQTLLTSLTSGLLLAFAANAMAADTSDLDALTLADNTPSKVERPSDWRTFIEGAVGQTEQRVSNVPHASQRMSLDLLYDTALTPTLRAVFADRLDVNWQGRFENQETFNTLKESYLSWQARQNQIFDIGRINVRSGVATGYNPTDFFRDNALRVVTSADPNSLRKNRLGSAMLRSQSLWSGGGVTALYSPKLEEHPTTASFSPDFGATNNRDRWLISLSQQLTEGISPQWLLYGEKHEPVQMGFNLTLLLNDATVAYVEWAGGRSRSLLSQALNGPDDTAFRSRLASGITYTAASKLSFTLEAQYNGAGLDENGWDALRRGTPIAYSKYRRFTYDRQDLPTKQELFFYGTWDDAFIDQLTINALARVNLSDYSRMYWTEARYHWDKTDLALQWQLNSGGTTSGYGAAAQERILQAVLTYFF